VKKQKNFCVFWDYFLSADHHLPENAQKKREEEKNFSHWVGVGFAKNKVA